MCVRLLIFLTVHHFPFYVRKYSVKSMLPKNFISNTIIYLSKVIYKITDRKRRLNKSTEVILYSTFNPPKIFYFLFWVNREKSLKMIDIFRGLKTLIKVSHVHIDSTIFRLHYTFTVMCLLAFSLIVTTRQYVGNPIDCVHTKVSLF